MSTDQPKQTSEQLWTELRRALLPFVRSKVPSKEIAEDIVQDVFVKIAQRIGELRENERLQPWAFRIARNAVVDYYRHSSKEQNATYPESNTYNDSQALTEEVVSWLPRFLNELPESERQLLEQVELHGVSQKDLAMKTGIPYSSLKSKVQRARGKLKTLLEDCCRIDFDNHGNVIDYRSKNCDC